MKKRNIILALISFAVFAIFTVCFFVRNNNGESNISFAYLINGDESFEGKMPPDIKKYYVNVICEDADENLISAIWKLDDDKNSGKVLISKENISSEVKCNVNFQEMQVNFGEILSSNILLESALEHTANDKTLTSYRYTGKTPDNYLWFNEEMWRIIGVVPACTTASDGVCSEYTNLVKIIRNDNLGNFSFNGSSTSVSSWDDKTQKSVINQILNDYYYKSEIGNDNVCIGYYKSWGSVTSFANCDFSKNGLKLNQDYIQNVYWNVGAITNLLKTAAEIYIEELKNASINSSAVGLLNPSDYGFATISDYYNETIYHYKGDPASNNWLYGVGDQWTINKRNNINVNYINNNGDAAYATINESSFVTRPVVYLKENVYVISGDGTQYNPYQVILREPESNGV